MEKRRPRVGDVVVFHDPKGTPHNALIKCVFDCQRVVTDDKGDPVEDTEGLGRFKMEDYPVDDLTDLPLVNLVHVSGDKERQDGCGRQTEIVTSLQHKVSSGVHGFYWRFDWEEPNPYRAPSDV